MNGMNILFVCTGNTCRSPMAAGLCAAKLKREKVDGHVLSAGLHAFVGQPVSSEAVAAVAKKIDISDHRARQVSREIMDAADLVITMTMAHKLALLSMYPDFAEKVYTLPELAEAGGEIDDPYGQKQAVYDQCARKIGRFLDKAWKNIFEIE